MGVRRGGNHKGVNRSDSLAGEGHEIAARAAVLVAHHHLRDNKG